MTLNLSAAVLGVFDERDPAVNRKRIDDLQHLVSVLKQEGIYVKLSFYFPLWFHLDGDRRFHCSY